MLLGLALSSLGFGLAFMSEVYIRAGISQYSRILVAYLHMHQPDSDNPGIVAIIQVITLGILHLNYAQLVFSNTIGALYAISLLAKIMALTSLDSRRILREVDTETEGLDGLRTSRIRLGLRNISFRKASTTNLSNAMESLSGATMDVSALRSTTEDREATVSGKGNIESVV
ncbi:hypothetical protein DXG01_005607 [Tephrocybe rancida]|nr:hypothetical protein DXG01_005607 [Tephrocybe rancida]